MGKYLLGLDEGTTGCKAVIFDFEGNVIGSDYREYPCYYPEPGWVEQKGDEITEGLFATVKAAIANSGVDPKEIVAMAMSSQGCVWGPLDKNGELLRPFLSWQDSRGAAYVDKVKELIDEREYYQISGYSLGAVFSITKYLWFKDNEPELFDKTEMFSLHQDYFLKEFGAEDWWADTASGSRTGVFDIDNRNWSEKLLKLLGLDVNKFPTICEAGKVVGKVGKSISEKTGLAEGTLLCVGAMDQNCSTLGGGLVKDGDVVVAIGTSSSTTVCSDKPVRDPNGVLWVKNNTGPENFTTECNSLASGASYRWYRDVICDLERAAGITSKIDPYELINRQIDTIPPGSAGLTFLPLLQGAAGGRNNPYARGCLLGATLGSTKAQFARAVLEGVTLEIKDNLEAQKKAGVNIEAINLTGGAVKSRTWNQMQADIYQVPVRILQTTETGCLGAAIYAGVGAGVYKSYQEAVGVAVHIKETYEPNPENFAAYDDAYARWCKAYDSLNNGGYFEMVSK
jgi:xylulokinase